MIVNDPVDLIYRLDKIDTALAPHGFFPFHRLHHQYFPTWVGPYRQR
jgi:hypothetical protein